MDSIREMVKPILAGWCPQAELIQEHEKLDEGIRAQLNVYLDDISEEELEKVKDSIEKALQDCGHAPVSYDELMKAAGIKPILGEAEEPEAKEEAERTPSETPPVSGTVERALINLCSELIQENWTGASEHDKEIAAQSCHVSRAKWLAPESTMNYLVETEYISDEHEEPQKYWWDIQVKMPGGEYSVEEPPAADESLQITQRKG